jgi:hypothetical protein
MEHILHGIPSKFVRNIDEIGHADWPNAHSDTLVAVPIGIGRTDQSIVLIGCIYANGSCTKSMTTIPVHAIDSDLALLSVSDGNCHICHQPNGFTDAEFFGARFGSFFVPEIE